MQNLTMQKLKTLSRHAVTRTVLASALMVATGLSMAATTDYQIDSKHTATLFSWNHFGFSNPSANFNDVQGTITVDDKHPEKSSVMVSIPVKSVDSHVEALDKEFLTDAWFNEGKYPNITFKSTKVQTKDKKHFKITGDLTVKGVTKPVVLDATLNGMGEHPMAKKQAIGFNATTSFKRSDFGIAQYVPAVSDEIKVNITTEALAK